MPSLFKSFYKYDKISLHFRIKCTQVSSAFFVSAFFFFNPAIGMT